jgi:hypothetical protein
MYALSKSNKAEPDEGIVERTSPPVLHSSDDYYCHQQTQSPRITTSGTENLPEEIDYVPSGVVLDRTRGKDAAMEAKLAALSDEMPPKKAHGKSIIGKIVKLPEPEYEKDIMLEEGLDRDGTKAPVLMAPVEASQCLNNKQQQLREEPLSAAHHEELKRKRRLSCRNIIVIAVLVIALAGLVLGVVLGMRNDNESENNALECSDQLLNNGYACGINDWPQEGFVAVFSDCPDGVEDASVVFDCATCIIYKAESRAALDPENDPTCNSCSVCNMTLAIDCSNLMEGPCAVSNCEGVCTG